jgi:RNA 3'-terminal phosphate cyclase (ATP)
MGKRSAPLVLDGSHGEGGGQILRTAVGLSAITGRAVRIERVRAGRPKPGLAAQHLTSARAVAALCGAELIGDQLQSTALEFRPSREPKPGHYAFDVAAARQGGSAGSISLVLQSVAIPLFLAEGRSDLVLRGGTHLEWSPPFDFLQDVWRPTLARLGFRIDLQLRRSGWFPIGGGEVTAAVYPRSHSRPDPIDLLERGELRRVTGRALAANLPEHVPRRMAARAADLLHRAGVKSEISAQSVTAACAGAGLFLVAEYERTHCGFNGLGVRGKPSEAVANEVVGALLAHQGKKGAVDDHLADQLLLPMSLGSGPSRFTVNQITTHLATNAWVIEQFGVANVEIADSGERIEVAVTPHPHA